MKKGNEAKLDHSRGKERRKKEKKQPGRKWREVWGKKSYAGS